MNSYSSEFCKNQKCQAFESTKERDQCPQSSMYFEQTRPQEQDKLSIENQLKMYQLQNHKLKNSNLDLQLKERQYVSKIVSLEISLAKLDKLCSTQKSMLSSQNKFQEENKRRVSVDGKESEKEERKFCQIMMKTYKKMFGMGSLKEIWKKHKKILEQWVEGQER